jgi:tetratricopeptide (TPR) repeat protein
MFHLRCYWIVVCSVSLILTSCGSKKTAEVIKSESQKSVALISHLKGHGVGFFIEGAAGVCTVLTAKHVVPDGKEISILTMTSKLPFKPLDIRRADNTDLAVVTFKPLDGNCPFPALKLGDSKDVVLTQPIYISSYPGGADGQAPKQSFYISSVTDKTPGGADGYELGYKTDTLGGTSGSPVLNEFGDVIAVHGRSYMNKDSNLLVNDRAYLDLAIPIDLYKQDIIAKMQPLKPSETEISILQIKRWQSKDLKKSIADYDKDIQLNPNDYIAYQNRGMSKYDSHDQEGAIDDFNQAIKLNPSSADNYYYRGIAKSNLPGDSKDAVKDFDRAIKLNPNYFEAYYYRGLAKFYKQEKEQIDDFNQAIKLNPHYFEVYKSRADAKSMLGKTEEAIADYDLAIKLNPHSSYLYLTRGYHKHALGKKQEGQADFKQASKEEIYESDQAIKINSKDFAAYQKRGEAKSYLNQKEEAIADFDRAMQINPNDRDTYYKRGDAKYALGRKEEAIADYDRAIQLSPEHSSIYSNRGNAKYDLGKTKEAIYDYTQAIKLNDDNIAAYYSRGLANSVLGKKEEARSDYQKATKLYTKKGDNVGYQKSLDAIKKLGT